MNDTHEDNDIIPENERANRPIAEDADTLDDSVVAEESLQETVKKLRERLKKAEAEAKENLTGWQRAKADMVNARKRDDEERKAFTKFAAEGLVEDLLPALESFDMAMANKEAWEKVDKNWRIGVEYIRTQFMKALADNGLTEVVPAIGTKFDHALHEAGSYEPVTDEKLDHAVVGIIQKGYSLNGKLLKVPKVKVGELAK